MTTTSAAGLRVRGLHRGGDAPLRADFDALPGESTAILSLDGSGAALLRAAIGLEPVSGGSAEVDGRALLVDGRMVAAPTSGREGQIALLTASPALDRHRTVAAQLAAAASADACCPDPIALARSYRLDDVAELPASLLPPHLQHRLALGRAVISGSRLVAAIAPWAGLAPRESALLEGMARVVAGECGLALAHATADAAVAARAARALVVRGGHVVADLRGAHEAGLRAVLR